MATKGKPREKKKSQSKPPRVKTEKAQSKSSDKRALAAFKKGQKAAKRGGTAVIVLSARSPKYKVYGGNGGRIRSIGAKTTASGIAGRLGVKQKMLREVDRVIDHLRLRKKIG